MNKKVKYAGQNNYVHSKNCCMKFFLSNSGEGYIDLIIIMVVSLALIYSLVELLPVFIKKQNLDYMAQSLARIIEITGARNGEYLKELDRLKSETGLDPVIQIDGNFVDGKLQLREKFTITLKDYVTVKIIDPTFAPPVEFKVPISRSVTGISEVYWKF